MKATRGVIAVGTLNVIIGGLYLLSHPFLLEYYGISTRHPVFEWFFWGSVAFLGLFYEHAGLAPLLASLLVLSGIATIKRNLWGRRFVLVYAWPTLLLQTLNLTAIILSAIIGKMIFHLEDFGLAVLGMGYSSGLLIFYSRRGVKEQFVRRRSPPG